MSSFVVTYDVQTSSPEGRRRLRRVAKTCEGYGQRVQYSVFEVRCSSVELTRMLARLDEIIDPEADSLMLYPIHSDAFENVIRRGIVRSLGFDRSWTL